ncbi:hypothetical protein [Armatimonas rosea]|uniref:Uncharacterized protein n=1 Tax=Armatimonas rosea TaxID=685828 RepID=A0A7W9W915_ARMRO|nr:hypothetical protein [Armatimonas rosea]MBB6053358.1 hypothetical protein [Armatimonas rosea]
MPTTKTVNNLPVLNKTITHWDKVETALGERVLLPDGATHDVAIDLAMSIQDAETAVTVERNALSAAQGTRDATRRAAHTVAQQARLSLKGLAKNAPDLYGLPTLLAITSAPAVLLENYTDIASVWERVNALPQARVPAAKLPLRIPLEENNGIVHITLEQFRARIDALRAAADTLATAESTVTEGIVERKRLHEQAGTVVKDYAGVARGLLPAGHALLKTIPTLSAG